MNKRSLGWFLFGLGGQLQIVASLSFTEAFVLASAPFLFLEERIYMKRNGVMPFFILSIAMVFGCVVSSIVNHTAPAYVLRGMAVCCLMPCSIVVTHWMLRKDMSGLKWSFVGGALSGVLCTFVFQKSVEISTVAGYADAAVSGSDIMGGVNYWIQRLGAFVSLPAAGWYLRCPLMYSVVAPLFMSVFAISTSVSGRGSAVRALAAATLVLIGGKNRSSLRNRICKHFWLIIFLGIVGAFSVKQVYQISASNGWLGEKARAKYESQTKGDTSLKALLLGGRLEAFCGLLACVDKPIIGFGPWAIDYHGYREEFMRKYANSEDFELYRKNIAHAQARGISTIKMIPCHAVVTELWLWYGIFGLIFCLYIFFVMLRYLKDDCWVVPQWFFWLGAAIPGRFWNMFLNPLTDRVALCSCVVACLIVRAVRLGRQPLPYDMIEEIEKAEKK